jgi:peptidyl-prolyl cis-trans isomerase C
VRLVAALVVAVAAAATAILAGGFTVAPYAAVVNGSRISQATLSSDLHAITQNKAFLDHLQSSGQVTGQGQGTFDSQFVASILSGRISLTLVDQALARRGITLTSDDLALAEPDVVASFASSSGSSAAPSESGQQIFDGFPSYYRRHLVEASAALTALEADLGRVDVSRQALARYYRAHLPEFTLTCVSDIAVSTQAQAAGLLAQIQAGADFARVAEANSGDNPQSGGALGCAPPGTFVQPFQSVVDSLAIGQVSQPVQVNGSWHLVTVTARGPEPFSSATPTIRQTLLQAASGRITARLTALERRADVSVNPQYGRYVVSGQQAGVVPPVGPPQRLLTAPGLSGP